MARMRLRKLGPEPWGARLVRAREEAGLLLRDVEVALPYWITRSTLSALEHRNEVPTRKIDRARVVLALVLYGVEPSELDLSMDDAPMDVDLERVNARGEVFASSRCIELDRAA